MRRSSPSPVPRSATRSALCVSLFAQLGEGSSPTPRHLPSHALTITARACLVPLAAAFVLVFRLPMQAREEG